MPTWVERKSNLYSTEAVEQDIKVAGDGSVKPKPLTITYTNPQSQEWLAKFNFTDLGSEFMFLKEALLLAPMVSQRLKLLE